MDKKIEDQSLLPPVAATRTVTLNAHGISRTDDYGWLRVDNWQQVMRDPSALDPEVRTYLEAENAWLAAGMADTAALQEQIFQEMKGRIKEDDPTVPTPYGPYAYFTSYVTGGQYPHVKRQPREGGEAVTLIDGDAEAEGKPYYAIAQAAPSRDQSLIAYAFDANGSEYYTIKVRDALTLADRDDNVPEAEGELVWSADGASFYYTRLDENHRSTSVWLHQLGAPATEDALVFHEPDPGYFVHVGETHDKRYVIIGASVNETSEIHLLDSENPEAGLRLIAKREIGHEYSVEHHEGRLIILTNEGGAEDFKIVEAPADAPGRENWREIEPHKPGRLILDLIVLREHMVRLERENGLPRIVIRRWSDGAEHAIAFDEEAYSLGMAGGYEYDTRILRFVYSSPTTPRQTFDYDMESRERTLRKMQEVPSGHNPADYVARRVFAPAADGEIVPVSLVYRKETPLDGSAPCLLYGYGAYGIAIPAAFSTSVLSLVDRGFVHAVAHIRGGKDKGFRWYKQGKLANKINSFTDFIAAGRYLAEQNFTSAGRIVGRGGSAGGLLMGAVANMAPDLFAGIIADVPFVDVLNTILDGSLPLTPPEWPEWGNPITDIEAYRTIAAYSPYDNVSAQDYPHMLVTAGLTDPRVTYWEPAKWVAKLRAMKTNGNLLLLKTNMEAGHGGASGRFNQLREEALAYAFALKVVGLGIDRVA